MPIAPPPSTQALVPAGNLFNGMSMGGAAPPSSSGGFPAQNTFQTQNTGMGYQNQNAGGMSQYNQAQYQMTPYGLPSAQQQAPQQQLGYMGGNSYNQGNMSGGMSGGMNGGIGGGGLAGPGQMLQIQAAGFDPYHQQQQQSNDPFSAFDGM